MSAKLRRGDFVEVKPAEEILATFDADGTIDNLPFMPEMLEFCGKRFQVSERVLSMCHSGFNPGMRVFRADDVVILDSLRCSGANHDGCQKACMIFWREAWLRKVDSAAPHSRSSSEDNSQWQARLKTSTGPQTYFCQASELLKATNESSLKSRLAKAYSEVRAGNCNALEMARRIAIWLSRRISRVIFGTYAYARGNKKSTPLGALNLQPGERVQVKPMESIVETLNEYARNRGLLFFPNMRSLCGSRQTVQQRLDKIIVDGTGEMRQMRNTVYLEGSCCRCAQLALGGCSRHEFAYWREIWLKRPTDPSCARSE
jgi:hypothetical protein